jgi:hypothetical protein
MPISKAVPSPMLGPSSQASRTLAERTLCVDPVHLGRLELLQLAEPLVGYETVEAFAADPFCELVQPRAFGLREERARHVDPQPLGHRAEATAPS